MRAAMYQLMRDTSWMTRAVLVPVRPDTSWFAGFVLVEATGTKFTQLNAFSISARNSARTRPTIGTTFMTLMSTSLNIGPRTASVRVPHSP
jgi:hypothetical protein